MKSWEWKRDRKIKRRFPFLSPQWNSIQIYFRIFDENPLSHTLQSENPADLARADRIPRAEFMPRILLLDSNGVITTATICQGNRRPVPSILANNLLSASAVRFYHALYKKKEKKKEHRKRIPPIFLYDLSYRFIFRYFSFSYPSIHLSAILSIAWYLLPVSWSFFLSPHRVSNHSNRCALINY